MNKITQDLGHQHLRVNRFNLIQFAHSMLASQFKLPVLVLLLVACNSQALTLGRIRGVALVGQSLDVAIQVLADPDQTPFSPCFEAAVFHADPRQQPSRVQVVVEPTRTARHFNARVLSPSLVGEPVVTVYLRSMYAQQTSRRETLLQCVFGVAVADD